MGEVVVIDGGLMSTIQDAFGRPGLGRFGVPLGGALDPAAASLANRLVGNDVEAPLLEVTTKGPELRWGAAAHIALAGADLGASVDGLSLPPGHSRRVGAGSTLCFGSTPRFGATPGSSRGSPGVRTYLAVEGGFVVDPVLGSASTDRRSGFGGFEGRAIRAGDVLRFQNGLSRPLRVVGAGPERATGSAAPPAARLLVIPTPTGLGWFGRSAIEAFVAGEWTVAVDSDRSGIRLRGPRIEAKVAGIPSLGVPVGSIQVPPSGQPIVTMADGPVTGGYPVIGVVPRFELGRLAQAAPGDVFRFQRATVRDARRASADAARREPGVEVDAGDLAAGWAR